MPIIAARIEHFLDQRHIAYDVLMRDPAFSLVQAAELLGIPKKCILRAVVMKAEEQLLIAVLPLGNVLDFSALKQASGKDYEPVAVSSVAHIFPDCEAGVVPPLGSLYQLDTYFDSQLQHMEQVIFEAGSRQCFIRIDRQDFVGLIDSRNFLELSRPENELEYEHFTGQSSSLNHFTPANHIKSRLSQLYSLPPCPPLLEQLQEFALSGILDSDKLIRLLDSEQELTEQLLLLSASPFFYRDSAAIKVQSLSDVIDVLGLDLCQTLVQGLLVWNRLTLPPDGPLGKASLLQQACLAAQVAYRLVKACGGIRDIEPVLASNMALLHNAGYLVLSHLFRPEYFLFNRMVQANPTVPVPDIEKQLLAYGQAREIMKLGHADVGEWLLQPWGFSDGLIVVCRQHHNSDYIGPYDQYAHLVILVNYLLKDSGLGDTVNTTMPDRSISLLGLNDKLLDNFIETILKPGLARILPGM